jgi:hypothetical protein
MANYAVKLVECKGYEFDNGCGIDIICPHKSFLLGWASLSLSVAGTLFFIFIGK